MRRGILVYNPAAGRRKAATLAPRVVDTLKAGGWDVEPRPTVAAGDATRIAREAAENGEVETVFAMGGDGTQREVAKGLLGSEVALGPIPFGTSNVLFHSLGLPRRPLAAARVLPTCQPRAIDVGWAGDEPFLMMASGGFDAELMARQHLVPKARFGPAAFVGAGAALWWSYHYPPIEVRTHGSVDTASLVVVSNIPHYGGPLRIAPHADLCDGHLDLVLFRGTGRRATAGFLRDLVLGRHLRRNDVDTKRVTEAEFVGPEDLLLQIDGDVHPARPPLGVRVEGCCLNVLAG